MILLGIAGGIIITLLVLLVASVYIEMLRKILVEMANKIHTLESNIHDIMHIFEESQQESQVMAAMTEHMQHDCEDESSDDMNTIEVENLRQVILRFIDAKD